MSTRRLCILCPMEHLEAVRAKTGNSGDLVIPCSPTGTGEPTHMFCNMALPEELMNKYLAKQELTTMEYIEPLEFLAKWNLKIIK